MLAEWAPAYLSRSDAAWRETGGVRRRLRSTMPGAMCGTVCRDDGRCIEKLPQESGLRRGIARSPSRGREYAAMAEAWASTFLRGTTFPYSTACPLQQRETARHGFERGVRLSGGSACARVFPDEPCSSTKGACVGARRSCCDLPLAADGSHRAR